MGAGDLAFIEIGIVENFAVLDISEDFSFSFLLVVSVSGEMGRLFGMRRHCAIVGTGII